jgi:excinuclease ABC subunit C
MSTPVWWQNDLPHKPGVYIFRDDAGGVLYVGKAQDLRKRVASYKRPGGDGRMLIQFLEEEAHALETIITRTESEAVLLEGSLIKQYKPPHNVLFKDDKSFAMVRIDVDEPFPRPKFVRQRSPNEGKAKGRSRLFGPFASTGAVRRTLSDLHRVVPLRDCPDSVMNHRSRPCLNHQLELCCAPCVDLVTKEEYAAHVERAIRILSGDTRELERDLDARMQRASVAQKYERAAHWRDRLAALRRTVEGQGVSPRDRVHRDVIGLARRGSDALVQRLSFREGRLAESRSHRFSSELPDEELLHSVLTALYAGGRRPVPAELVLPVRPADPQVLIEGLASRTRLVVPRTGERRRMLDIAQENARAALSRIEDDEQRGEALLEELARLLGLDDAPHTIDCFDISNLQGTNIVASRVRFTGGLPDKDAYRRFRVKTVDGQDDFASMREVVGRSLTRGARDDDLPDLVLVDGGAQQVAKALEARDEAGAFHVAVVGIAKARPERGRGAKRRAKSEERLILPGRAAPLELPKNSGVRHLLERIRDEAHRFAITYHRKERGKVKSKLDSIPGIGPAKRKALLKRFGSVRGVAAASVEELSSTPGISDELAQAILRELS